MYSAIRKCISWVTLVKTKRAFTAEAWISASSRLKSAAPKCRLSSPHSCRIRSSDQTCQPYKWPQMRAPRELVAWWTPLKGLKILVICARDATVKHLLLLPRPLKKSKSFGRHGPEPTNRAPSVQPPQLSHWNCKIAWEARSCSFLVAGLRRYPRPYCIKIEGKSPYLDPAPAL